MAARKLTRESLIDDLRRGNTILENMAADEIERLRAELEEARKAPPELEMMGEQ